jgi:hypothetical protein
LRFNGAGKNWQLLVGSGYLAADGLMIIGSDRDLVHYGGSKKFGE